MSKINTKKEKKRKLNTAENLEKEISGQFRRTNNRHASVPLLYRLVYSSRTSIILVFVLLLSFVLQGASLTYAQVPSEADDISVDISSPESTPAEVEEIEILEPDSVVDETPIELAPAEEEVLSAEQSTIQEPSGTEVSTNSTVLSIENSIGIDDDVTLPESPPLPDPPGSGGNLGDEDTESLPDNEILPVIDNEDSGSTTASSSPDSGNEEVQDSEATSTPEVLPNDSDSDLNDEGSDTTAQATTSSDLLLATGTTSATSTEVVLEEAVTITNSDTEFTFNRNECTTLASGSFYCLKADTEVLEDALFAAPDNDGDLEIYLVRNSIQSQVTSNQVDDAAPFFDQNSDTIVWHRLINDRYQIISYDIATGEETQLTNGEDNSMEPTRQGKYTVWQNWSNNNWNVVLFDGKEMRTITESGAHDIAPYVHGSLVVWNRYSSGQDKTIEMYDMISETYVTVDDPEGLSVTNPRMVFVYDSLHPNGDVVTKGYDMISRKFIQLDTLPKQLPDEIPESESTGETRALIQSKPSVKSDEVVQNNTPTSAGPVPPNPTLGTSSEAMTLDLTIVSTSSAEIAPVTDIPLLGEYELIIPPLNIPTETVQE